MGLSYYPRPGEILLCRFDASATPPEMTKTRPVVVAGPRLRRRANLVTIVPLSTTTPEPAEAYHCRIELESLLPAPFDAKVAWAKCDMVQSVALARLDRFKVRRRAHARTWMTGRVSDAQLAAIRRSILAGLGF